MALGGDSSAPVPPVDRWALTDASRYIAQVRWKYAKTMPDWPHEYTIKAWLPDLANAFESLCQLITSLGHVGPWPPAPEEPIYRNHYLVIGEHKYWAMGPLGDADAIDQKTLINRTAWPSPARLGAQPREQDPGR